jgi:hypothetical protein
METIWNGRAAGRRGADAGGDRDGVREVMGKHRTRKAYSGTTYLPINSANPSRWPAAAASWSMMESFGDMVAMLEV